MSDLFDLSVSKPFTNSAVEANLRDFGYRFTRNGPDDYRFKLKVPSGQWFRAQLIAYPELGMLRMMVFLTDSGFDRSRVLFVREVVERLNRTIIAGAFVCDIDGTAGVAFRTAREVDEPTANRDIERLLNGCSFPISLFSVAFNCWKLPKATAKSAVQLALMMEDCDEVGGVSDRSRRELLSVSSGGDGESDDVGPPSLSLI